METLDPVARAAASPSPPGERQAATSAGYPAPKEGDWIAPEFRFHSGDILRDVRLHYTTVGAPSGDPVLILHGTGDSSAGMLAPDFAGELFGPGQPLDATRHFIVLPDAIGHGKSAKPSDGLRTRFPRYNYADLVLAQYRLLTEGLGVRHLRLTLGNSMGGMETWTWGVTYPGFMDALVPMAALPAPMGGRNWMLRRLMIETIRNDPAYRNGDYVGQPPSLRIAKVFFAVATSGGTPALHARAPTRELADKYVEDRLAAPAPADANDFLYQWEASSDYDPSPGLERIEAAVLAINSADDERYPLELGALERAMTRVKNGRMHLIPASADTCGHGTTAFARFWAPQLREFLQATAQDAAK
jgi:homoserine O-acetyltransferase/O-succinyltransferase